MVTSMGNGKKNERRGPYSLDEMERMNEVIRKHSEDVKTVIREARRLGLTELTIDGYKHQQRAMEILTRFLTRTVKVSTDIDQVWPMFPLAQSFGNYPSANPGLYGVTLWIKESAVGSISDRLLRSVWQGCRILARWRLLDCYARGRQSATLPRIPIKLSIPQRPRDWGSADRSVQPNGSRVGL